jgi:hypothetical protein
MSGFGVILLRTSTAAMRAEKLLTRAAIPVRLIPVPREISSQCGVALRLPWSHCHPAQGLLREAGLEISSVHHLAECGD